MSTENLTYIDYILMAVSGVIAFLGQKLFSMRRELSEVKATAHYKKQDLDDLKKDVKELSSKIDMLCGRIDEHLRR